MKGPGQAELIKLCTQTPQADQDPSGPVVAGRQNMAKCRTSLGAHLCNEGQLPTPLGARQVRAGAMALQHGWRCWYFLPSCSLFENALLASSLPDDESEPLIGRPVKHIYVDFLMQRPPNPLGWNGVARRPQTQSETLGKVQRFP